MTYPHHYHRETIFTGAGWPYRCRCGEGDAIGGVRGDNCPAAMREEIARLTGAVDADRAAVVKFLRSTLDSLWSAGNDGNLSESYRDRLLAIREAVAIRANVIEAGWHIAKENA